MNTLKPKVKPKAPTTLKTNVLEHIARQKRIRLRRHRMIAAAAVAIVVIGLTYSLQFFRLQHIDASFNYADNLVVSHRMMESNSLEITPTENKVQEITAMSTISVDNPQKDRAFVAKTHNIDTDKQDNEHCETNETDTTKSVPNSVDKLTILAENLPFAQIDSSVMATIIQRQDRIRMSINEQIETTMRANYNAMRRYNNNTVKI